MPLDISTLTFPTIESAEGDNHCKLLSVLRVFIIYKRGKRFSGKRKYYSFLYFLFTFIFLSPRHIFPLSERRKNGGEAEFVSRLIKYRRNKCKAVYTKRTTIVSGEYSTLGLGSTYRQCMPVIVLLVS